MAANAGGKVDPKLVKFVDDLVKEVTLKAKEPMLDSEGEPKLDSKGNKRTKQKYSLTDVIKVLDRKIKVESLRLNIEDHGYGAGFGGDDPVDEPETPPPEPEPDQ